jgi:hypothetical protein
MKKKLSQLILPVSFLLLLAACSTPESRIQAQQTAFNAWPADVQQKVRAGQVDVGFTPEMVHVALGDPDRTYGRVTAQGASEVWVYADHKPKFSVGIGVGSSSGSYHGGSSTAVGVGLSTGNDTFQNDEKLRIVFMGGKVIGIETRMK